MRIRAALLAVALTGTLAAPVALRSRARAAADRARDDVKIDFVYYDAPGRDNRSWRSLNAEYVVIKNTGRSWENLSRYSLASSRGPVYRFERGTWLRGGQSVVVHTGPGRDWPGHVYMDRRNHIWDNDRDRVVLREGRDVVDTCWWFHNGRGFTSC